MTEWIHSVPTSYTVKMLPPQAGFFQVSCVAPEPEPVVIENLVEDSSFDTGDGWQFYIDEGNPSGAIEYGEARITGDSIDDRGRWMSRYIPVEGGVNYLLHGTLRGEFTDGGPYMCAVWFDASKTYIGPPTHSESLTESDTAVGVSVQAPAPADAAFVRVEVRAWGIVGSVWCDDVHFGPLPPQPTPEERLLEKAAAQQTIMLNPEAALQREIYEAGFWPTCNEFEVEGFIGQRAEHPQSGEVRVYYVPIGDWDNVQFA